MVTLLAITCIPDHSYVTKITVVYTYIIVFDIARSFSDRIIKNSLEVDLLIWNFVVISTFQARAFKFCALYEY